MLLKILQLLLQSVILSEKTLPDDLNGLRHAIFVSFQKLNGVFASVQFQK